MSNDNIACAICGKNIDTDSEPRGSWIISRKKYYHIDCYNNNAAVIENDIIDYCKELYGACCNVKRIKKQIKEYIDEGKSMKDIYMTLRYWYEIKHKDPSKAQGGIGIVGYVYQEAMQWCDKMSRIKSKHVVALDEKPPVTVTVKTTPVRKPKRVNLFDIR